MHTHHLLVAESPIYLLGLETVITQFVKESRISICQRNEDLEYHVIRPEPYILWWALPISSQDDVLKTLFAIVAAPHSPQVVMLQHIFDPALVRKLYDCGVSGFLSDLCSAEEIHDAIRALSNGQRYLDNRVSNLLSNRYLDSTPKQGQRADSLTEREREVLSLIIGEYTTREIAAKLYISKCTVETHRLHMIRKLKVKNTAGLVREALSQSLL